MVDTTMFILQLIGLAVILFWALAHDRPGGEKSGLLAQRGTNAGDKSEPQKARRRPRSGLISEHARTRHPNPSATLRKTRAER
jgi:hypothetical protein